MQVIQITSLSGHSPYDITICDISYSNCSVVATGVVLAPVTVTVPTLLQSATQLILLITDSIGCEYFEVLNCITPNPTPTITTTPTVTPTNISCNCITFVNDTAASESYSYTDCDGFNYTYKIGPYSDVYVCGKDPNVFGGPVTYSMGSPCVANTCPFPSPTPTTTPTNTPTISLTPSSTPVIVDCVSYITTGTTDIFKYNIDTNALTLLTFPSLPSISDIANNSNKFWITDANNPQEITEYYINPTPFVATFNRILYPSNPILGLCVKDSNTLISTITGATVGASYIVVEVDISTTIPTITNKFSLPSTGRQLSGDLFYFPQTDKLFVSNKGGANTYLTQYDYTTGTLEYDITLNPSITGVYGLSSKNNNLYLFEESTGKVYRLDNIATSTFTLVQTTISGVYAASSDVSCAIAVTPTPTPSITPSITPTITPTISLTPTITPTPTYPYLFDPYVYLVPEPQDTTSLTDLGNYMFNSGSTSFLGWGNGGVPSTGSYSNDLNIYIHYSGFTGGSGNFITDVSTLKGYIRQLTGTGTDTFGCTQNQYTFNTIQLTPSQVNTGIQYFYTLWIPLNAVGGTMSNMTVDIGSSSPCSTDIVYNSIPDSVLSGINVTVSNGAAIPSNVYRVLWIDPTCLLPSTVPPPSLSSPIFFKGNTKT